MGVCGSDLLEKFGPQIGQLVACEKGKEFIDVKVKDIKNLLYSKSDELKNQAVAQINNK